MHSTLLPVWWATIYQKRMARPRSARAPSLHVAMQTGPSHHPVSWTSGVWPLRILISSCLGFFRFIVSAMRAISIKPSTERRRPASIIAVVVIPRIAENLTHTEELTELVQAGHALLALRHRELVSNLETGLVAASAPGGLAAARIRLRSILLRLRNRSPSHGTRSAFPAGFPHSSRCHCRHHVGCIRVVRDTRVFQHIARCAPHHYWCGGQRIASRDYLSLLATLP